MQFEYQTFNTKVLFGKNSLADLPKHLEPYRRPFIIGGKRLEGQISQLSSQFADRKIFVYTDIKQHVPVSLVDHAFEALQSSHADLIIAIGGGSTIGLAKALALRKALPIAAIPTTYAGSEQTNIYGITTGDAKQTGRDNIVLPGLVVYDPILTQTMPATLAVKSALNAMAHLIEAIYSPKPNPVTQQIALYGVSQLREGLLEMAATDKLTSAINERFLLGAYLAGKSLNEVPMALHHKVAHVLGGSFQLDHASVHSVLLPYVLAYQWPYLDHAIQEHLKKGFNSDHPARTLKELAENTGLTMTLESIGFSGADIENAANRVIAQPYPNPAPITKEAITDLLNNAYYGLMGS